MFGMGWPEIAVVTTVALLVFGPERLPDLARQAAHAITTMKRVSSEVRAGIEREVTSLDIGSVDPRASVDRALRIESPRDDHGAI